MPTVHQMDPRVTETTCQNKRRYDSPGQAEYHRLEHYNRGEYSVVIYRCDWCFGYHLGKQNRETMRRM